MPPVLTDRCALAGKAGRAIRFAQPFLRSFLDNAKKEQTTIRKMTTITKENEKVE